MPELLDERVVTLEFADLILRRPVVRPPAPLTRTPGFHQSGILSFIAHNIGVLKPGEKDEEDPTEYPLLWGLGCAWEEYAVSFYPDIDWQPGEITVDGISMNADGISLREDGETMLEEFKLTFKGVATGTEFLKDTKFWMWGHQGREYAWGYGPRVVRWHVCHVRGDYKKFGPIYKQYVVRFSDSDCEQTHRMLLNNLHGAKSE